jgi:hypothetical protein
MEGYMNHSFKIKSLITTTVLLIFFVLYGLASLIFEFDFFSFDVLLASAWGFF